MDPKLKRTLGFAGGVAVAAGLGALLIHYFPAKPVPAKTAAQAPKETVRVVLEEPLAVDLDQLAARDPDVVVNTKAFTSLWRDILKAKPVSRIVNEDLLFYYDESEAALSLKGTVKRIAFERDMTVLDEFFAFLMERPLKLAYWKAYHGRLGHFLGITNRTGLTDLMTKLAPVALDDKQLMKVFHTEGGVKHELYKLQYTPTDAIYFMNEGDDFIFMSSLNLPHPDEVFRKNVFPEEDLKLDEKEQHAVISSVNFLSFGYQFFSPSLEKVRFKFNETGWTSALQAGELPKEQGLLSAVPVFPAACSFAPVSMERVGKILSVPEELNGKFEEEVAVCWYENSEIYSPLFVFKGKEALKADQFKDLFASVTGTYEKGILSPEELEQRNQQIERMNNGETVDNLIRAKDFVKAFDPVVSSGDKVWRISREVSTPWGRYPSNKSKFGEDMRSRNFFKLTLAQYRDYFFFSPDDKLVENGIAALSKKYPNAGDVMKEGEFPLFLVDPGRLVKLMKESVLESLPVAEEALFRETLMKKLFPVLGKLEKEKPILAALTGKADGTWKELEWRTYSSR